MNVLHNLTAVLVTPMIPCQLSLPYPRPPRPLPARMQSCKHTGMCLVQPKTAASQHNTSASLHVNLLQPKGHRSCLEDITEASLQGYTGVSVKTPALKGLVKAAGMLCNYLLCSLRSMKPYKSGARSQTTHFVRSKRQRKVHFMRSGRLDGLVA